MIHFEGIDTPLPPHLSAKSKDWINRIIERFEKKTGEVFFLFCSDAYLHQMNVKYLDHDTLTDIITFDLSDHTNYLVGELYISLDRVMENAKNQSVSEIDEVDRVMIHGILHLLGYNDKTSEEALQMRSLEDLCLSLRHD